MATLRPSFGLLRRLAMWCGWSVALVAVCVGAPAVADPAAAFEAANKLYYEGRYADAATAYEKLFQEGQSSAALHFNLGNALFKSSRVGRAMAQYRMAERLSPHDADIQANLRFARELAGGRNAQPEAFWERALKKLTVNEWAVAFGLALWVWLFLLLARELRPTLAASLRGWLMLAGAATVILGICTGSAAQLRLGAKEAVVIVDEAVVRYGPLEQAESRHSLRDGAEVTVTDQKDEWLEVTDSAGRAGWLRKDQVQLLP